DDAGEPDALVAERPQLAGRDHQQLAVELAHLDEAEADVLHRAGLAAVRDEVAHADGVVEEQEQAGDDVLDEGLRAEADGQPGDARAGQQRPHVEPELAQDHDGRHAPDDVLGNGADEVGHGQHALPLLVERGQVLDAVDRPPLQPPEDAQHGEGAGEDEGDAKGADAEAVPEAEVEHGVPGLGQHEAEAVGSLAEAVGDLEEEHRSVSRSVSRGASCVRAASDPLRTTRYATGRTHASSAARPGSVLPSMNSSMAPPPVETCVTASARRASLRAATESPPPTTVSAPRSAVAVASARATARVPSANGSISNAPIGPFQITVAAPSMTRAYRSRVAGPMSRPIQPSGISPVTTFVSAAASKRSPRRWSEGSKSLSPARS